MSVKELFKLDGRVALVTGGSRGLGLQMAEALGEMGCRLAITARKLGKTESSYSLSIYVITGPLLISISMLGVGNWQLPDLRGWLLFGIAGTCSVIAWIGIIGGYRRAAPAMLAPFEYTALVGGALAGYLIWDEVPDRWVTAGAIVIIASGLFVVYRELGGLLSNRYLRVSTAASAAELERAAIQPHQQPDPQSAPASREAPRQSD